MQEIEKLKETLAESRKLVFAATNTILELLHLSLRKADHDVLSTCIVRHSFPLSTIAILTVISSSYLLPFNAQ